MSEIYATADLWLAAYFLSESDAHLEDIQVSRNGQETISFAFRGENLTRLAEEYCREEALANVTQLRSKINLLRDIIFQSKRN